ncbi:MAG: hypothetical protein AB1742_07785 [bacterium]
MREAPWSAGERATKKEHTSASAREKVSGLERKHRLVSRAPLGSEGGDDSPQSKAACRLPVRVGISRTQTGQAGG